MKIVIGVLYQGQLLATWETREELRRDWADVDDVRPYSFFQIFQGDGVFALGAQVNPWARDEFRGEFEEDEFEEEEQEEGLLTAVATISTETLRRLAEEYSSAFPQAGLDFVGFEIDREYYDNGNKRFKNFVSQGVLF